jgi:hypothetical protein
MSVTYNSSLSRYWNIHRRYHEISCRADAINGKIPIPVISQSIMELFKSRIFLYSPFKLFLLTPFFTPLGISTYIQN